MNDDSTDFGIDAQELDALDAITLLDVRRAPIFTQASTMIPGARWCDPATVDQWASTLPRERRVVVYCVHGHQVSQGAAAQLRAAGLDARFLRGGIEGWVGEGRSVQDRQGA